MIGIIGDLHLKESLGYADYIADGREEEKKEILDFMVKQLDGCNEIVFMGDSLNGRNNTSKVIKEFINLLERFGNKQIFIMAGNHEKKGDGSSALDFLKEIKGKRWRVISDKVLKVNDYLFCPYFHKSELNAETNEEGQKILMDMLKKPKIKTLFTHHAFSDIEMKDGVSTDLFNEILLPKFKIKKMFNRIIGAHVHYPHEEEGLTVTGSVFNNQVNETQKYIWKFDQKTNKIERIKLPGRAIYKIVLPKDDLDNYPSKSIAKIIMTEKVDEEAMAEIKKKIRKFDAHILIEQYPKERKKMHFGEGESILEMPVEKLLEIYSKQKKVPLTKLLKGFELIKGD